MKIQIVRLTILLGAIFLILTQQAYGQDWMEHVDEKARVRYSLPPDWTVKTDDGPNSRSFSSISPDKRMLFYLRSEDPGFSTDDEDLLASYLRTSVPKLLQIQNITIRNDSLVIQPAHRNNIKGVAFQAIAVGDNQEVKLAGLLGFYKQRSYLCVIGYYPSIEGYLTTSFIDGTFSRLFGFERKVFAETSSSGHSIATSSTSSSLHPSNERWSIVMSKELKYPQAYHMVNSVSDNDWIKQKWSEGFFIDSIASGHNRWLVVMSKGTPYTEQTFSNESPEFPKDFINAKWDDGFRITSIARQGGKWVVLMSKGSGYTHQVYLWGTNELPMQKINDAWGQGNQISYLASDQKSWLVVMSKGSPYTEQVQFVSEDSSALHDWISQKWTEGYYITSMASLGSKRAVIMSKGPQFTKQFYWTTESLPEDWIKEIWKSNYRLTNVF